MNDIGVVDSYAGFAAEIQLIKQGKNDENFIDRFADCYG